jgi:lantibiotic biosynthesis protein
MSGAAWQPILGGDLAERARIAVRAIGDSLATADVGARDAAHVALFWAYASGLFDDAETEERYAAAVDRLVDSIGAGFSAHALFGGLAGDGFVIAHVASDGGDELLGMIDRALVDAVAVERWDAPYDLVEGIVGLGVYFRERLEATPDARLARDGLAHVVRHLAALAVETADGTTWRTPMRHVPAHQQDGAPEGYFNCGVAHGVPGAIPLLAAAAAQLDGKPAARARALAAGATRWILAQQLAGDRRNRFPSMVIAGPGAPPPTPTRTAWCYGDLGVGAALWGAAARAGAPTATAAELVRAAAARAPEDCNIVDAGLCHGASGMAHVLNRCHQASGDPALRVAAIDWYARTLDRREPGRGIGGFLTPPPGGRAGAWHAATDLLEGGTGIGLALIAAVAECEPGWDRLLLCDVPTAGSAAEQAA